ncbi:hypothetical protein CHLNCDRAFT_136704 [Chlorella variabilis]|uniref:Hemerythrin-like domain-containing protein n=1 Tax=Chlorella variabilis TaxID=554065 RepID=E1ZKW2_CHLVA|nr:hypothetical protein CHLNCDRAFT_136704 [Chlorella variabilis]EFN53451.1 hypothetical protein CHLNCDRAFT_136704 [Chlorella variabilis]|eukprot:XP_005845553.1 hypothetical protein CHLNCDRAFT_136704 [Chlorella variabilis]
MSHKVAPLADCTSLWTYPLESDGWFRAHNALRADMDALASMLQSFEQQLDAGTAISRSQAAAATRFVQCFLKFLHHHHHNEDDIATPYLATRCTVPEKIAADHTQLEALLERFEAATKALLADSALVRSALVIVQRKELAHLKEIERNVVQKSMGAMEGEGVGPSLPPMTKAERRAFAPQEGIPFFIRWILFRHAAKYERNVWQPFQRECLAAVAAQ